MKATLPKGKSWWQLNADERFPFIGIKRHYATPYLDIAGIEKRKQAIASGSDPDNPRNIMEKDNEKGKGKQN